MLVMFLKFPVLAILSWHHSKTHGEHKFELLSLFSKSRKCTHSGAFNPAYLYKHLTHWIAQGSRATSYAMP